MENRQGTGEVRLRILQLIEYGNERHKPYSSTQIADILQLAGSTVSKHLSNLQRAGLIEQLEPGYILTLHLTTKGRETLDKLPKRYIKNWGQIAAGPATEIRSFMPDDVFSLPDFDPETHFAMTVAGSSMLHLGIFDGDIVVFRKIDSWMNVQVRNIVALRVPEGTDVANATFVQKQARMMLDANEPDLNYTTMKQITSTDLAEIRANLNRGVAILAATGRQGTIRATAFSIEGILVYSTRQY